MQRKNEVTIVFCFFHTRKTLKISAPNSNFFSNNDENLLFNYRHFQQVLLTWNENLCERSKKIEVEDRIHKTDGEDEETVLDFLVEYEVVVDLVEEFASLGKARKWKICYFIGFSAQALTLGVSFFKTRFKPRIRQPSEDSSV